MTEAGGLRLKRRWLLGALVIALSAGCARADWIENTLVTADVTGAWSGTYSSVPVASGAIEMVLQQAGANVTGTMTMTGLGFGSIGLAIRGVVNGDTLRFNATATLNSYDLVVNGEQMLGSFYIRSNRGIIDVRRRQ